MKCARLWFNLQPHTNPHLLDALKIHFKTTIGVFFSIALFLPYRQQNKSKINTDAYCSSFSAHHSACVSSKIGIVAKVIKCRLFIPLVRLFDVPIEKQFIRLHCALAVFSSRTHNPQSYKRDFENRTHIVYVYTRRDTLAVML